MVTEPKQEGPVRVVSSLFLTKLAYMVAPAIDLGFAGRVSVGAAAAVTTAGAVLMFVWMATSWVAWAGMTHTQRVRGEHGRDQETEALGMALGMCMGAGVLIGFLVLFLGPWAVSLTDAPAHVRTQCATYLWFLAPALAFDALSSGFVEILVIAGRSRTRVASAIFEVGSAAVLNATLFVALGDDYALEHIAMVASVSAFATMLFVGAVALRARPVPVRMIVQPRMWPTKGIEDVVRTSVGSFFEPAAFSLFQATVVLAVAGLGEGPAAARGYAWSIAFATGALAWAIGGWLRLHGALLVGRSELRSLERDLDRSRLTAAMVTVPIMLVCALFSETVFRVFTRDPDVIALCRVFCWVGVLGECARTLNIIHINFWLSVGTPTVPSISGAVVSLVSTGVLLLGEFGFVGLAVIYYAEQCGRPVINLVLIRGWSSRAVAREAAAREPAAAAAGVTARGSDGAMTVPNSSAEDRAYAAR